VDVVFEASFERDRRRIRDKSVLRRVQEVIEQLKGAASLNEIASVVKMQGYASYYRIRLAP